MQQGRDDKPDRFLQRACQGVGRYKQAIMQPVVPWYKKGRRLNVPVAANAVQRCTERGCPCLPK